MDRKRNMKLLSCNNTIAEHEIKKCFFKCHLQTCAKLPQYVMDVRSIHGFKSLGTREGHGFKV